ncbi:MAG: hypothetical protein KBD10_01435 [Candidatus Pacebacteria bacterium]|nr:hypothetical protein [Candidatus Paceibacterota bacterium]
MQDIIPPQKRKSIRDIPIPDGKQRQSQPQAQPQPHTISIERREEPKKVAEEVFKIRKTYEEPVLEDEEEEEPKRHFKEIGSRKRGGSKKTFLVLSTILILAIVGIFISRSGAKVYVYAKELSQSSNVSVENIPYNTVEITSEKTVSIKATGEEKVTEKAKGKITIYNEYEETEQRLLKNTRFESPNGLIYRIPSSVIVPGSKRDDKGNVVAGKLEVEIVADEVGEKYNIGASKFTVPGFKDLPQFESFYAKSEGDIAGGFDGIRKVISESDRQESETLLKNQLKEALLTEAKSKTTPENLVLADESMILYEILSDKVEGNNVSISAKGTIKATSFDYQNFSNTIAKSSITQFSEFENVVITNIDKLNISVSKQENDSTAKIELSGSIDFLWKNNEEELKRAIAGTDKNSIKDTVELFPGITKISSEVRPMWKKTFPEDVSKIEIIDSKN